MASTDDYLILDKPSGVPSHATSDNYIENTLYAMQKTLGIDLYLPHRLDVDTSGILIMCKSKEFLKALNNTIKLQQVVKRYKTIIAYDPSERLLQKSSTSNGPQSQQEIFLSGSVWESFLKKSKTCPKTFSHHAEEDTIHCESKIVDSSDAVTRSKHEWLDLVRSDCFHNDEKGESKQFIRSAIESWMAHGDGEQLVTLREIELELITGRTHQVRGQVSVLYDRNCHVAGDNMYIGLTSSDKIDDFNSSPYLALQATSISFGKLSMPKIKLTKKQKKERKKEQEKIKAELEAARIAGKGSIETSTEEIGDKFDSNAYSEKKEENTVRSYSTEKTWWEDLVLSPIFSTSK